MGSYCEEADARRFRGFCQDGRACRKPITSASHTLERREPLTILPLQRGGEVGIDKAHLRLIIIPASALPIPTRPPTGDCLPSRADQRPTSPLSGSKTEPGKRTGSSAPRALKASPASPPCRP